jgi:hypothetical protein
MQQQVLLSSGSIGESGESDTECRAGISWVVRNLYFGKWETKNEWLIGACRIKYTLRLGKAKWARLGGSRMLC